ncbi:MAG: lysophospholipid acyltransferase family protein [Candidatus Omnitrophica bacterium]|nr:lysophospholipid acyltransferase family protein [Candidatus Omnitrophota bacterium]
MYNYLRYRIGQTIAMSLPLRLAYAVAIFFSDIHYLWARHDRKVVLENLKAIFPEENERSLCALRLSMFRSFAKYLADFFRFDKINAAYIKKNIRIENLHFIDEGLAKKKGVIIVTAHLGNWELGAAVMGMRGYQVSAVALPHTDTKTNDFFNHQRVEKRVHVIAFGKAARECLASLEKNMVLALVGDRDFAEKGVTLPFFGKPTLFPEGPAAFALRTGASIVPGFMLRNPDDTFTLRFEKPIVVSTQADKHTAISRIITQYIVIFEEYIRRYPQQWFMFRKFWNLTS